MSLRSVISSICTHDESAPTPSAVSTPATYNLDGSASSHILYAPSSSTTFGSQTSVAIFSNSSASIVDSPVSIHSHSNSCRQASTDPIACLVFSAHASSLPGTSFQSILSYPQPLVPSSAPVYNV